MNDDVLFHLVLEQPAQERAIFLAEVCSGDPALHQRLAALLLAHENPGSFLQAPAVKLPETAASDPDAAAKGTGGPHAGEETARGEEAGRMIGPYQLLQQVGEGGMGTVWLAEQTHPVQRKVALKIIKAGMDSRQVLARFQAERQALALMDHPNIARVLEAGTTPEGSPYFAMELVNGQPITRYCDEQRLTPRQRLELFVPVCQAIQHAHHKGIIHRDVKPSNVLVAAYDGKPVVKVIDFGIAKATDQRLAGKALFTEFGAVVGTLEYMSPEQAEANQLDIDTRSDVYSLGVLLYELLTGTTPLERTRLKKASLLEVLRLIREEEPQRPSTRVSTTEELPAIAANRGVEPKKLSGLLRGELDWIVMKALEKDRNRRYETANGFAADVQRYLADEPVAACPPSTAYRFKKFLRRNKGPVLAAALVLLTLLGGIVGTTWQAVEASWASHKAVANETNALKEGEKARTAEGEARKNATEANKQRGIAEQQRDTAAGLLYDADLPLANQALRENKLDRARELLSVLVPSKAQPDLRGWDWHYLQALCGREQLALGRDRWLGGDGEMVGLVAWSPHGRRLACYAADYTLEGNQAAFALRAPLGRLEPRFNAGSLQFKGQEGTFIVWEPTAARRLFRFPSGHQAWALDWSPDGGRFASAGRDGTVRVWDPATGRELARFPHLAPAFALSWSPDGRRLVVHSAPGPNDVVYGSVKNGTVTVWEVGTGRKVFNTSALVQHWRDSSTAFPFTSSLRLEGSSGMWGNPWGPDGKRLIVFRVIDNQTRAVLLDADTGADVALLNRGLSRSRDSRHLIQWNEKTTQVLDWATGQEVRPLPLSALWQLSPDGNRLLSGTRLPSRTPGRMTVWDVTTGREICTIASPEGLEESQVKSDPIWGADGKRLLALDHAGRLVVWDAASGRELIRFKVVTNSAYTSPEPEWCSPDGLRVAIADRDGVIRVWDLATGQELLTFRGGRGPRSFSWRVQWSPDSRWLLVEDPDAGTLKVWDAAAEQEAQPIYSNALLSDIAWAPDSRRLAGVSGGPWPDPEGRKLAGKLTVWDAATGQNLFVRGADLRTFGVAWSPDGKQLATIGFDLGAKQALPNTVEFWGTIKIWDARSGKQLRSWRAHSLGNRLAWSPDGKRLASLGSQRFRGQRQLTGTVLSLPWFKDPSGGAEESQEIKVWDAETGKELCQHSEPQGHGSFHFLLAWSPDGRHVLASLGRTTRVLDAATGKVVGSSNLEVFALSPDGRHLALAEKAIRIHAFSAEGPLVRTLEGHTDGTDGIAWSPDGRRLASSGHGGTVKLWDVATGYELLNLPLGTFQQIAWSPDGRRLALSGGGGQIGSWRGGTISTRFLILDPLQPPSWQPSRAQLCHRLARQLAVAADSHLRDPAKAVSLAQEAVRLAPEMGAYWNTLGLAQYRAGNWPDAVVALDKTMTLREGGSKDWFFLAMAHQKLGNKDEARTWYDRAVEMMERPQEYPRPIEDELRRFQAEAAEVLGVVKTPEQKTAEELERLMKAAWSHRQGNRWGEALDAYTRATEVAPKSAEAWVERGNLLRVYTQENFKEAAASYSRALEINPNNAPYWSLRGSSYAALKEWDKALADFSKALDINPNQAPFWHQRGHAYLMLKEWDKAIADLSRALELAPRSRGVRTLRGEAHAGKEEWDKALADYSEELKNDRTHIPAWEKRADLYARLGQWDKAVADYTHAITTLAGTNHLRNRLAWLLANCPDPGVRNPKRALQLARETAKWVPGWGEALDALGAAHYRVGDWPAAVEALTAAANDGAPVGWFVLAMAQAKVGNKDEARKWFDKAVAWMAKNGPKDEELRRFRAEAAAVLGLEKDGATKKDKN